MTVAIVATLRKVPAAVTVVNNRLAEVICRSVGTMACAYLVAVIGAAGIAAALTNDAGLVLLVGSISGYFLQLVLLPIIIVGQNLQAARASEHHELLKDLHGQVVPGSEHAP